MTGEPSQRPDQRLKAAIYLRQSLDRTGDELAVDRQLVDCTALAAERGWDIAETVTDNSVSASAGKDRAGYLRVLELIRSRAVDRIVVWHIDRLYRTMLDLEHLVLLSEQSGVRIATVSGDIDLSTDMGRLVARVMAAFARAEIERKSARQKRANRQRREAGEAIWTRRPFGYDRDTGGRPVVVDVEAQALLQTAEAATAGVPLGECARRLNDAGLPTTVGNPWVYSVLKRTLLSPRYVGQVTYLGDEIGVAGTWPALWDEAVRSRLLEALADPARNRTPSTALKHWLSGALSCGVCGATMYSSSLHHRGTAPRGVYQCRSGRHCVTRVRQIVEDVVEARLLARLADPAFTAAWQRGDGQAAELRNALAERRRARDDVAEMLADGLLPRAEARPRLERIRADVERLEAQLAAAAATSPVSAFLGADDRTEHWAGLGPAERRRLLLTTAESVTVLPVGRGVRSEVRLARSIDIRWR